MASPCWVLSAWRIGAISTSLTALSSAPPLSSLRLPREVVRDDGRGWGVERGWNQLPLPGEVVQTEEGGPFSPRLLSSLHLELALATDPDRKSAGKGEMLFADF